MHRPIANSPLHSELTSHKSVENMVNTLPYKHIAESQAGKGDVSYFSAPFYEKCVKNIVKVTM